MKAIKVAIASLLLSMPAMAQPVEVLRFHERLGGGELILVFCAPGLLWGETCIERQAVVYGQVCDSYIAESMGTGKSGDVRGGLPGKSYRYTGFRCSKDGKLHSKDEKIFGGGNWMN